MLFRANSALTASQAEQPLVAAVGMQFSNCPTCFYGKNPLHLSLSPIVQENTRCKTTLTA